MARKQKSREASTYPAKTEGKETVSNFTQRVNGCVHVSEVLRRIFAGMERRGR